MFFAGEADVPVHSSHSVKNKRRDCAIITYMSEEYM